MHSPPLVIAFVHSVHEKTGNEADVEFLSGLQSVKKLVDVAGIEPATPCLQMRTENTMWLSFLAFTYVVIDGF